MKIKNNTKLFIMLAISLFIIYFVILTIIPMNNIFIRTICDANYVLFDNNYKNNNKIPESSYFLNGKKIKNKEEVTNQCTKVVIKNKQLDENYKEINIIQEHSLNDKIYKFNINYHTSLNYSSIKDGLDISYRIINNNDNGILDGSDNKIQKNYLWEKIKTNVFDKMVKKTNYTYNFMGITMIQINNNGIVSGCRARIINNKIIGAV